jgi:glucosamine-6-phosphate deaminase
MRYFEVETYEEMSRKAANLISAQVITEPHAVLGLATGSTPIGIYRQLIDWYKKGDIDFSGVTSVNLDEYLGLSGDHPQSYRFFMEENFFKHINIAKEHTFVPNGIAQNPDQECAAYDEKIKKLGGIDMQLLGIGLDGHIGFNEPDDSFVKSTHIVTLDPSTVEANARFFSSVEEVPKQAITMGMISIMQAKRILLVANGENKREILQKAMFGPITPKIPASILQLHPNITVIYSKK